MAVDSDEVAQDEDAPAHEDTGPSEEDAPSEDPVGEGEGLAPETQAAGDEDDDLSYSRKVQKRIGELNVKAKKAESRAIEAERRALAVENELAAIHARFAEMDAHSAVAESRAAEGSLEGKIAQAERRYREARESIDTDAELAAQKDLWDLREQMRTLKARSQEALKVPDRPIPAREDVPRQFPKATQDWLNVNGWYLSDPSSLVAEAARRVVRDLEAENRSAEDPDTYRDLNKRLREELGSRYAAMIKDPTGGNGDARRAATPPTGGGSAAGGEGKPSARKLTSEDLTTMRRFGMDPDNPADRKAWLVRNDPL